MRQDSGGVIETTLLELVDALSTTADDDREVVAVVHRLLEERRVRLVGNFRDCTLDDEPQYDAAGGWE